MQGVNIEQKSDVSIETLRRHWNVGCAHLLHLLWVGSSARQWSPPLGVCLATTLILQPFCFSQKRWSLDMLPRLASESWAQAIFLSAFSVTGTTGSKSLFT